MKLFTCINHDYFWPVDSASVVVAKDEAQARLLLDAALQERLLKPFAARPYTLKEIRMDTPAAYVLNDGDY